MGDRAVPHEDPAYYEALGRAIKLERVARGMERRHLATASGVSYPYLSEIESGSKRPSSRALLAIAEALGVALSALLGSAESLASEEIATRPNQAEARTRRGATARREALADVAPLPRAAMMSTRARAHSRQPSHDVHELVRMLESLSPHDQELVTELIRRLSR